MQSVSRMKHDVMTHDERQSSDLLFCHPNSQSSSKFSEGTRGQKSIAESQGCHLWAVGRGMFCRKVSELRKHSDGIVCLFSFDLCMAHATKFLHLSAQGKELPQLVDDSFTATKGLGACEHFQVTNLLETTA